MLKNLWHVVRHFKAAFILNLLGLAVAFTAFMMIMMQVRHEQTFDRCYDGADRIVRLDVRVDGDGQAIVNRPLARMFAQSSPEIEASCLMQAVSGTQFLQIERNGVWQGYSLDYWDVSPGITEVFGFDMIEGDRKALETPHSAIISESMARRLFGNESAVGKLIGRDNQMTVTGVYRDFPRNATIRNILYTSMNPKENYDNWGNWNYYCFLKLSESANPEDIIENFRESNPDMDTGNSL